MPKLFHFPWLRRLLNRGVNTDVLPELMPDGTAREAINVRPGSITGNAGGAEAVKGEQIQYPSASIGTGYVLIGSCTCNNKLVEFWASSDFDFATDTNVPVVRIDGVVVAQSRNIPYVYDRPLQIAVVDDFYGTSIAANEDSNGVVKGKGVVYPADHNSAPLYWDVQLLLDSLANATGVFFEGYTIGQNSVGLFNTPEFPVFTALVEVATALNVGQYQYALRYVTPQGDRTNIGPWTPMITVPKYWDNTNKQLYSQQSHYPGATTIGGIVGETSRYGIEIKFRVDNVYGFQEVEIVRKRWNEGISVGQVEVVKSIQIQPNQNSIETFVDPSEAVDEPVTITDEEENIKVIAVNKPKTVEYSDRRLTYANFETFPKVLQEVEFIERDGKAIFPVTQGVATRFRGDWQENGENPREHDGQYYYWNDGYSDPVNNTYLKSFMRGERYGIGVMFWNQFAEQSFVTEVPLGTFQATNDGYLFPNRRDRRAGRSLLYSDGYDAVDQRSTVQASTELNGTPDGVVFPTFEAFSQGAVRKNIAGQQGGPWDGYGYINREASGAFRPFGQQQIEGDQSRLSQSPNRTGAVGANLNNFLNQQIIDTGITGNIWAPRHYALGAAIEGIRDIPSDTTVISVMRTEPAKRVVAQGIACWADIRNTGSVGNNNKRINKSRNRLDILIPDFKNAIVDDDIIASFQSSPTLYKIQFVSPLGFFTEQYSGGFADHLSFASVQWDNGEWVNNGIQNDCYTNGASSERYVGYGSWGSNAIVANNAWTGEGGNKEFGINSVQEITQYNNQKKWRVTIDESVYGYDSAIVSDNINVNTQDQKNFREPWYVVNIIQEDATILDNQVDKYIETGYHIKVESCIGVTPSAIQEQGLWQQFPLLNERRGDVYCNGASLVLPVGDPAANRYVWVDDGQAVRPWLCVTDNDWANDNQAAIIAALNTTGEYQLPGWPFPIYGVYSFVFGNEWLSTGEKYRSGTVEFGRWWPNATSDQPLSIALPMPSNGSRILVRYDNNEPIKFFGGDCTVSHSLDALFNGRANLVGEAFNGNNNQLAWQISPSNRSIAADANFLSCDGIANPYFFYTKAPEYLALYVADNGDNGGGGTFKTYNSSSPITTDLIFPLRFWQRPGMGIRQWVVYWSAEQRSVVRYYAGALNVQGPYEWPRLGYIMRYSTYYGSNIFNSLHNYDDLTISPNVDFNFNSNLDYNAGGFLLANSINNNYREQAPITGFGVPFVSSGGTFEEKFYFPTGLIASAEFNQLVQDVPSLRTFTELTLKTISEENGEIKTIASALAGGGRNIYAWTDNGVARILTSKNVLTGASGEEISTQAIENYWGQEMWLSRNIGIPDQMWQAFVKGYAPTGDGYADNFFWANRNSLYRMVGDNIIDIGREKFLAYMLPILRNYPRGYVPGTNGFYNAKYNEAWMSFNGIVDENGRENRRLVVFNPETNSWNGLYTYDFDGYTQVGNDVYGHRSNGGILETYLLDQGWTISNNNREASVTVPMVGDQNLPFDTFKEFLRWRVTGSKPDAIEILDPDFVVMSRMDAVTNGSPLWVKEYDGWEGWASRTLATYDASRKLPQKRYFYLRLIWNTDQDKSAISISGQLKSIK
jgi:hypothetical protein